LVDFYRRFESQLAQCSNKQDLPRARPQRMSDPVEKSQLGTPDPDATTFRFTDDARGFVSQIGSKIAPIDGEQGTNLMIENDVGVSTVSLYPVKKIDTDFDESI
jgi:hypothetical protein